MTEWSVQLPGNVGGDDAEDSRPASGSETFAIEDSLGYLLNRTARLMANELAERLRPAGVAIGQWAVLLVLWARDGLVIRMPDADDGRLSRIHLTERGWSLRDELVPLAMAVNDAILQRLTVNEGRTLRRLLTKVLTQAASG